MQAPALNQGLGRAVQLAMALLLHGCVNVDGGAVELSWDIRQADGSALDGACGVSRIARVGLCARRCDLDAAVAGDCQGVLECPKAQWSCEKFSGSTSFDLAEGPTELFIEAYCADGSKARGVQVPSPIVRRIAQGKVSQLNALLITLPAPEAGDACP